MCEAAVYLLKSGKEELIMEAVDSLEQSHDSIKITNLFGEERVIRATVARFSLLNHKIILEPC